LHRPEAEERSRTAAKGERLELIRRGWQREEVWREQERLATGRGLKRAGEAGNGKRLEESRRGWQREEA
jgi:hypothetical protein